MADNASRATCVYRSIILILYAGVLTIFWLSSIVIGDYGQKTAFMQAECFNCANPIVGKSGANYYSKLNCTYEFAGADYSAEIQYPGNIAWASWISQGKATNWAALNNNGNFTCYLENPSVSTNGYQILLVPASWCFALIYSATFMIGWRYFTRRDEE